MPLLRYLNVTDMLLYPVLCDLFYTLSFVSEALSMCCLTLHSITDPTPLFEYTTIYTSVFLLMEVSII